MFQISKISCSLARWALQLAFLMCWYQSIAYVFKQHEPTMQAVSVAMPDFQLVCGRIRILWISCQQEPPSSASLKEAWRLRVVNNILPTGLDAFQASGVSELA